MKAVGLTRYLPIDDPRALEDFDLPKPVPEGRDILVAVRAVAVNPVDTKQRAPRDAVEETPRVLGYDASGIVEAVGPDATLFKPGDEVFYAGDVTRPGTNQEFHLVDERIVGPKPKSLSFAEAAALPLTAITAYESFFDRLGLDRDGGHRGRSILIIGRRRGRRVHRDPACQTRGSRGDHHGLTARNRGLGARAWSRPRRQSP